MLCFPLNYRFKKAVVADLKFFDFIFQFCILFQYFSSQEKCVKKALTFQEKPTIISLVARNGDACPGVAQFGSALEWGSRGREFDSRHSDQEPEVYAFGSFFVHLIFHL